MFQDQLHRVLPELLRILLSWYVFHLAPPDLKSQGEGVHFFEPCTVLDVHDSSDHHGGGVVSGGEEAWVCRAWFVALDPTLRC